MKYLIAKPEEYTDTLFTIYELSNYESIPDPRIRCGVSYNDFLYVLAGKVPLAEGNLPLSYKINLSENYIEPVNLSLDGNSDSEIVTAGIINTIDQPFTQPGFIYSQGENSFLVTVIKTSSVVNGYLFVSLGLSDNVNGLVKIKKIDIDSSVEISDIAFNSNGEIYFLSKEKFSETAKYDTFNTYNIETGAIVKQSTKTNLVGKHSLVFYGSKVYIIGGKQFDFNSNEVVSIGNKLYSFDVSSPTESQEISLDQNSTSLSSTLLNPPLAIQSNRVYISALSESSKNIYMLNLDSFLVTRKGLEDNNIVGQISFCYNSNVYIYNSNTMALWSTPGLSDTYLIASHDIQFILNDPIQKSEEPYFQYRLSSKNKNIYIREATLTNIFKREE